MKMIARRHSLRSPRLSPRVEHRAGYSRADTYVGTGFRYWLTGLRTGELSHWERAFTVSAQCFGVATARDVCRDFSQWVRLLSERSHRELLVSPLACPTFCHDECVAMALIAAYQNKGCPALQVCAMTLLGCEPSEDVCAISGSLASRLSQADHILSDGAIAHVVRYAKPGPAVSTRLVC